MSAQYEPPAKEVRGYLTVTVPVTLIQRMQRFTDRRMRSAFVTDALTAALDRADAEDRERAAV